MVTLNQDELNALRAIDTAFNANTDPGSAVQNVTQHLSFRDRNELLFRLCEDKLIEGAFVRNAANELHVAAPSRVTSAGRRALSEPERTQAWSLSEIIDRLSEVNEATLESFFISQNLEQPFRKPGQGWGKRKRVNEAIVSAKNQGRLDAVLEDAVAKFVDSNSIGRTNSVSNLTRVAPKPVDSNYIFVIMPFGEKWSDSTYAMLQEAARLIPANPPIRLERADEIAKPGRITLQIEDAIRRSSALIADITGVVKDDHGQTQPNPNVMWELGYAHACEKSIVILNQNPKDSPFDMQDWRQVKYSVPNTQIELEQIARHISEALEK